MPNYNDQLLALTGDQSTPFWLSSLARALDDKDPVDALNGCEVITALQRTRVAELQGPATPAPFDALAACKSLLADLGAEYERARAGHTGRELFVTTDKGRDLEKLQVYARKLLNHYSY